MPSPDPARIASRDARRLAAVLHELGGAGAPISGGWMACDLPGSWADYAAGLGVDGPVDDPSLDALTAFYRRHGRRPRIQITPYQHPSLLQGLAQRGFVPYALDTVLVHALDPLPQSPRVPGLVFRRLDRSTAADVAAFCRSQEVGFFGRRAPPAGMLPITERVARSPRCSLWLLELDGRVVGSGGLEIFEEVGVLIAGCVHEEARRQGLQSAFIRFRLQHAAKLGLAYVTVGSSPGGPTERNALRAGFSVAYTQIGLQR